MDALEDGERNLKRLKQEVEDLQGLQSISQSRASTTRHNYQTPASPTGPAASRPSPARHPTFESPSNPMQSSSIATPALPRHKTVYPDELKDVLIKIHNQLGGIQARVGAMATKVAAVEVKLDEVNERLGAMDEKLGDIHRDVDDIKHGVTELGDIHKNVGDIKRDVAELGDKMTKQTDLQSQNK